MHRANQHDAEPSRQIEDLTRWLAELDILYELRPMVCRLLVGLREVFGADFTALALDTTPSTAADAQFHAYCPSRSEAEPIEVTRGAIQPEVLVGRELAADFWRRQEDRMAIAKIAEERLRILRDGTLLMRLRVAGGTGMLLVGPRPERVPHARQTRSLLELVGLHLAVLVDRVRLREEADHDPVSGVLSRTAIFSNLRSVLERASVEDQPVTIGIIELDRLDDVHRTIGHPAGEKMIRAVSQALSGVLRPGDWLGRYGGEEFLVILPATRMAEASDLMKSISTLVSGVTVDVGTNEPLNTTLSIGLLALEYGGTTAMANSRIEDLVAVADFALLQAKRKGGNTVHKWSWRHAEPLGPCA